jgi:anti-sigma-K factor RskA
MSEHPFEMYDGAYILGALSEEDRRAYEQHLLVCDRCSESVAQLRDIPHALAAVPASVLETETPPPSLLPSLLQRTRRERNRRRWIVGSLVAAAAACIVALSIVVAQPDHTGASHPVAMQAVADAPIKATADVQSVDWGTRIDLVCRYYEPVTAGRPYALIVVDRSGERHTLGTWNLVPGKVAKYGSGTSLTRDKIASVQIATVDGQRALLTLNL